MEENKNIRVFMVEDDMVSGTITKNTIEKEFGFQISWYKNGASFLADISQNPEIVILDYTLPDGNGLDLYRKVREQNSDIDCIMVSGQDDVSIVVEAYKAGIKYYIVKNQSTIVELLNAVKNISSRINLKKEVEELREQIVDRSKYRNIIGESESILKVLRLIQKVEKTNVLTLITGESGTGKELVAQAIHNNSTRSRKPFVAVNLAAIPADLIESELFGHEKGAFTGAVGKRHGKFEEANGGTIFLDEIGEMDINLQTKLLRVLQENKVNRLGSNKEISIDMRVIAATNKQLSQQVKDGRFREDLYYRIQGFLIHLPPLRERGKDVMLLANSFLDDFCLKNRLGKKKYSDEAIEAMIKHNWPGNVRELKAFVERSALITSTDTINISDMIFSPGI